MGILASAGAACNVNCGQRLSAYYGLIEGMSVLLAESSFHQKAYKW
jgi:hypothetical protein